MLIDILLAVASVWLGVSALLLIIKEGHVEVQTLAFWPILLLQYLTRNFVAITFSSRK